MSMPCTTTFEFQGHTIVEYKGLVRGIVVRAPTISQGIVGGLKKIVGGRIGAYREMCEQARGEALEHLLEHAEQMGANGVVGLRYESSEVDDSATEVLCYGTAVVINKS
ncbi:MAG: YbjQ family protein [Phycisphaerales bacterium]|nr:YbjQ family protein [Phycisphaerales bacterium]